MPQSRETGAAANRYGKETAIRIAKRLKTKKLSNISNEVERDGKRAVIKCAHYGNIYIGVTTKMLERLDQIIAALENEFGKYELYVLPPKTFKKNMRIGFHKHIGLVHRKVFQEQGTFLTTLDLG
jgi:hypothetical protein